MKITDIEVIPLRIPEHNIHIADGIQDDVIVRVHTDEGITRASARPIRRRWS